MLQDALASLFDEQSPNFLALPHQYFDSHQPQQIARHVATLIGECCATDLALPII